MVDARLLWPKPWPGYGRLAQPAAVRPVGREHRCRCIVAAKKQWEEVWEPREVTLDKADLMQLEMRRMLGEDRQLCIAKLVAKKLNPSATNLEVDKIVKQKGVKTFLNLLAKDSAVPDDREVRLLTRPSFNDEASLPPRRDFEHPGDEPFRSVSGSRSDGNMIELTPKPRGAAAAWSPQAKRSVPKLTTVAPVIPKPPEKPVPVLHSRPARGGASMGRFPEPVVAATTPQVPPLKPLPVPNLSSKPEMPPPVAQGEDMPVPGTETPVRLPAAVKVDSQVQQAAEDQPRQGDLPSAKQSILDLVPRPEVSTPKTLNFISPAMDQGNNLAAVSLSPRPSIQPSTSEASAISGQEKHGPSLPAERVEVQETSIEGTVANRNAVQLASRPQVEQAKAMHHEKGTQERLLQETMEVSEPGQVDSDWALAEVALDTKSVHEVTFVGSNAGGMIIKFGHLNGFLPGKDLLESRGLKTFRAWARERGHDANHTSILDSSSSSESTCAIPKLGELQTHVLHPACDSELERVYREQRLSLLSSLVGQKAKVTVTHVEKAANKLVFSERKAALDDPEIVQRRADLMANLKIGDVVNGRVKNISLFGVFVELVEGVSGLMHFSELSWTPVSDPAKFVHVGQDIEALVLKLDHDRQRIYLSLKRLSPDPLLETVESILARQVDGDSDSPQAFSIPELEALLSKLGSREEIQRVSKGRLLRSASVVPAFQVYLSSELHDGGYKLIARFGNQVQEVLFRTSLERTSLKSVISQYTTSIQEEII